MKLNFSFLRSLSILSMVLYTDCSHSSTWDTTIIMFLRVADLQDISCPWYLSLPSPSLGTNQNLPVTPIQILYSSGMLAMLILVVKESEPDSIPIFQYTCWEKLLHTTFMSFLTIKSRYFFLNWNWKLYILFSIFC